MNTDILIYFEAASSHSKSSSLEIIDPKNGEISSLHRNQGPINHPIIILSCKLNPRYVGTTPERSFFRATHLLGAPVNGQVEIPLDTTYDR